MARPSKQGYYIVMRIYGLDFTSAPSPRKPITCAVAVRDAEGLFVERVERLETLEAFDRWLATPGPWVAGLDFPFGQPIALIEALDWGASWPEYVGYVAGLSFEAFAGAISAYRGSQPSGRKHRLRAVDHLARSISPMMLHGVPVGRMFYQGAPRLLRAGVSVIPGQPSTDPRIVLEAYPAVAARRWAGRAPYKSDDRRRQTAARADARDAILLGLLYQAEPVYGFRVEMPRKLAEFTLADPSGDSLDAILCAVQAAWAAEQPDYAIPPACDPREGWIADPAVNEQLIDDSRYDLG